MKNMKKFKIYILGVFIVLVVLLFIVFIYNYLFFKNFKNNCVEQIYKRDFGNYISIYFKPGLLEEKQILIKELKDRLSNIEGVQSIKYISSIDAAKKFIKKMKEDKYSSKEAIEVLIEGVNPEIFESSIEINPSDDKTEDYFRNAINTEIKNSGLEKDLQSFKISIINKKDYIKTLINFPSFIKLKLSPRAQDLKSYYNFSDCEILQIAPLYGVEL